MKKYIVGSCTVTKGRKYNYIDIYNLFAGVATGAVTDACTSTESS